MPLISPHMPVPNMSTYLTTTDRHSHRTLTFSRFIDFIADSIDLTTPAIELVTCTRHGTAFHASVGGLGCPLDLLCI